MDGFITLGRVGWKNMIRRNKHTNQIKGSHDPFFLCWTLKFFKQHTLNRQKIHAVFRHKTTHTLALILESCCFSCKIPGQDLVQIFTIIILVRKRSQKNLLSYTQTQKFKIFLKRKRPSLA